MEENKSVGTSLVKLSSLGALSEDAVIIKDADNIILDWNTAAERVFGFSREEAIGNHISIIIPQDKQAEENQITNLITNGVAVNNHYTVRLCKSGKRIHVMLSLTGICNEEGEIIAVNEIVKDITARRDSEEKQEILAGIVTYSDDAIISKDLEGNITSWNKAAEIMFGYPEDEIIGKSINVIIPKNRQMEELMLSGKINKGEKVEHFETVRLAKDGRELRLSITLSPIKNSKGEIIGSSKIARDISEQVQESKQLKLYNQRLENLNSYKDEFIGMASHELKTPLTSINANLQILERKMEEGENKVFISKTLKHVGKLTSLISELLDVTKVQAGQLKLNISNFNFAELLEESIESVQLVSASHAIVLESKVETAILADRNRLEQVLTNLLTNAIKYSPEASKVLVNASIIKDEICVSVQDFGIGIPGEEIQKVFSRYFRVEGLAPTFSGLGIGLYICSKIIQLHNGEMWVESEVGKGSTFYFTIPL